MPPLILEGATLGERHRHYNRLLKNAIDCNVSKLEKINYEDNDIDNFMKIDLANSRKDVGYILEVLKSEDLLYVSRALKRSAWLVTEPAHAHVVNPQYLHQHLFPHMTTKAINKLLHHIRIHLKDEKRVKAFYFYNNNTDPKTALKWLPNCPVPLILQMVKERGEDISLNVYKRLFRSPDVLGIYQHTRNFNISLKEMFKNARCLLKEHTEIFLNVCDLNSFSELPSFGKKSTQIFLKNCPDRIISKFENHIGNHIINLPTFIEYIVKNEGIKNFLVRQSINGKQSWFNFRVLQYFLDKIPKEEILDLLKTIFKIDSKDMAMADVFYAIEKGNQGGAVNVYRWYQLMPFTAAKYDLQKLIYAESAAEERESMLSVFLACAGQNPHHIRFVLKYYHDRHINEPYKFKIPFINNLLETADVHKFDEETWNLLNDLFHSMEVYIESDNDVNYCIETVIVYKVLRDEKVPEIIEEKFKFGTIDWYRQKLNQKENEKIFQYLQNYLIIRLKKQNTRNETEFNEAVSLLKNLWNLLKSYKKEQGHYQIVVEMIKKYIEIKKKNRWSLDLSHLYKMLGRWRCHLFSESLSLCASDEVCLNALKHDPLLLVQHSDELHAMRAAPRRLLTKLRIYWPHTLGKKWTEQCLTRITSATPKEHKVLVKSLYILLPSVELTKFIEAHSPTNKTIHCSEINGTEMSLRRHIAKNMHLARHRLPTDLILKYANGDYLQYSQLSLNAIFHDMNSNEFREHIPILLNAPVSQQKHGIRLALKKIKPIELKSVFAKIWKSTTNVTIREILFTKTYDLLCKAKKTSLIKELWNLLSSYIDELTHDENYSLYYTLHKVSEVPLCVRVEYYVKSYHFMKTLPKNSDYRYIFDWIVDSAVDIIEFFDPDFVTDVLLESAYDKFRSEKYTYKNIMGAYLLCCKDEETQNQRYNQLLKPILEQYIVQNEKGFHSRGSIEGLLKTICNLVPNFVFGKKMVVPAELISNIFNVLATSLDQNDYVTVTSWKLTVAFIKIIHKVNPTTENDSSWHSMMQKLIPHLGDLLLKHLEEDLNKHFPLVYLLFLDSCKMFFRRFNIDAMIIMNVIELLLRKDMVETYLIGLWMLPNCSWENEKNKKKNQLCRKIYSHPSPEVKMHYLNTFTVIPSVDVECEVSCLQEDVWI